MKWLTVALAVLLALSAAAAEAPVDRAAMAKEVKAELLYSWHAYEQYAWGHDELKPLSKQPRVWYGESLRITPVDSRDTLLLLDSKEEAETPHALIVGRLSFDNDVNAKASESTNPLPG